LKSVGSENWSAGDLARENTAAGSSLHGYYGAAAYDLKNVHSMCSAFSVVKFDCMGFGLAGSMQKTCPGNTRTARNQTEAK
jgi:hypothetical protein